MNPTPQDDLDKMTLEQKIKFEILSPLVTHQIIKYQKEKGNLTKASSHDRYDKAVAQIKDLLHQERSRADAEGRIDELNYWFKLIEKNSDEAPIEVSLVKAIKVRLERLATLTQKEQSK